MRRSLGAPVGYGTVGFRGPAVQNEVEEQWGMVAELRARLCQAVKETVVGEQFLSARPVLGCQRSRESSPAPDLAP